MTGKTFARNLKLLLAKQSEKTQVTMEYFRDALERCHSDS